ncbi:hypothetical protein QC762_108370 [Podospora pseudocomata]|uniref:Uncharacterized protein n=1 Tax=Podospora pseudocomata TaxID=2093779 RepID=A0ABR0GU03_9PEZI|nr:hypothetical protein QC762_108370 [Podospora pseudocomata]
MSVMSKPGRARDSTMAVGLDKLERLEKRFRLFSTSKKKTTSRTPEHESEPSSVEPWSANGGDTSQTFPSPSFIRPTSQRMMARDEVVLSPRQSRRAQSLPDAPSTPRMNSLVSISISPRPSNHSAKSPRVPQRTSSLSPRNSRTSSSLAELLDFSFDGAGALALGDNDTMERRSRSNSKVNPRSTSPSVSPKAPINRKRCPSEQEGSPSLSFGPAPIPTPPCSPPASPPVSPSLVPRPLAGAYRAKLGLIEPLERSRSVHVFGEQASGQLEKEPRKTSSLSTLRQTKPMAKSNTILKEPSLDDFMALSDDEILDGFPVPPQPNRPGPNPSSRNPPSFPLPPDPPVSPTPRRPSATYPLLTLSPPLASRPATAAAFEAARIAAKYNFDLVYVVNLWPNDMGLSRPSSGRSPYPPSPPQTPISGSTPSVRRTPSRRITGRLLAAYGLSSIKYPFRISAPVHEKVLQTEGWLEYRSDELKQDEHARGYMCSFHTCYHPSKQESLGAPSTKKPNRGIVFAAYRNTPTDNNQAQLELLREDAETLVDLLIDIHSTQRERKPSAARRYAAQETGPLPSPPVNPISMNAL